jgi:hypothetical protein
VKTFVDSQGRTWQLALTIDAVKRVRGLLGVNLLELEQGDPPLLTRLGTDVILLCDVIFALVKPEADRVGVTDEQFGAALGGDAILAAQKAFYEELIDFFRRLGRGDLARASEKQQQVINQAVAAVEKRIDELDVEAEIAEVFGISSGNSPASSASTPGR